MRWHEKKQCGQYGENDETGKSFPGCTFALARCGMRGAAAALIALVAPHLMHMISHGPRMHRISRQAALQCDVRAAASLRPSRRRARVCEKGEFSDAAAAG